MKSVQFWNKMADGYDNSVKKTYSEAYNRTIEITRQYLKPADRVLEVGCGTGIVTAGIAANVTSILAIDPAEKMIVKAKEKMTEAGITNVTCKTADMHDPEVSSGTYDVVTAFNVLYFLDDIDVQLRQIHSMLPENGYFLSVTDCMGGKSGIKNMLVKFLARLGMIPFMREYSTGSLIQTIEKAGFKIARTENLYSDPPNLFIVAVK
jgi:ubiquinone/menaquinone biosynthesis C-methylase UbiE